MKKCKILKILASVLAVAAALGITAAAAYDSSEDPLITWSYLRDIFQPEILDAIDKRFEEYEIYLDGRETELDEAETDVETEQETSEETSPSIDDFPEKETPAPSVSMTYEVIELKNGDALYAVSACDIMLRSGAATCIAPDEKQGIADYTSGEEIYNGMPFTKNHMCLIPRGDGRGIQAASESVFIMVRGDYTIVYN